MKTSYKAGAKSSCDCKCEDCFEDSDIERVISMRWAAAAILLLLGLFVVAAVVLSFS